MLPCRPIGLSIGVVGTLGESISCAESRVVGLFSKSGTFDLGAFLDIKGRTRLPWLYRRTIVMARMITMRKTATTVAAEMIWVL